MRKNVKIGIFVLGISTALMGVAYVLLLICGGYSPTVSCTIGSFILASVLIAIFDSAHRNKRVGMILGGISLAAIVCVIVLTALLAVGFSIALRVVLSLGVGSLMRSVVEVFFYAQYRTK